jgi:tRNA dimethylallyltransferase
VVGPTGVGKTAFAVALAEKLGAEIVGADAFQIYREIPILTAAPTGAQRAAVPHHLVGTIPVADPFDAATYARAARTALADIHHRGKRALIVGGTGLYLRALTTGLDPTPPIDHTLRAELNSLPLPDLLARLAAADPAAPAQIDAANPRRVQRAIEICETSRRPLADFRTTSAEKPTNGILLTRDRTELLTRIDHNVTALFSANVESEIRQLGPVGPTASRTLGLREIQAVLRGDSTRAEASSTIALATRQYAKRQLTWFRNQLNFEPLDLTTLPHLPDAVESACRLPVLTPRA